MNLTILILFLERLSEHFEYSGLLDLRKAFIGETFRAHERDG